LLHKMREIYTVEQLKPLLNNYPILNIKQLEELRILSNMLSVSLGNYLYNKRIKGVLAEDVINKIENN